MRLYLKVFSSFGCMIVCCAAGYCAPSIDVASIRTSLMSHYDIQNYALTIEATDTSGYMRGHAAITASIKEGPFDTFAIELSDTLKVDSIKFDGTIASYLHVGDIIKIAFGKKSSVNDKILIDVYYQGNGVSLGGNGVLNRNTSSGRATFTMSEPYSAHLWYPCKQVLTDKIDSFEMHVITDSINLGLSNGTLKAKTVLPDGMVDYYWSTQYPCAYYLIFFAISSFIEEDFKVTNDKDNDSVLIQNFYYDQIDLSNNQSLVAETKPLFKLFSGCFGEYPFKNERYGICHVPNMGKGMENQTLSFIDNFEFGLFAHEMAHQWFGNSVTCSSWQDIWLQESFASYSQYLALQFLKTQRKADSLMNSFQVSALAYPAGTVYVGDSTAGSFQKDLFNESLTYRKGASVVHMLRYEINNDSLFFACLKNYQQTYKYGSAKTADFQKVVEQTTGLNVEKFFQQWIYGEGYPIISVSWSQLADTVTLIVKQTGSSPHSPVFTLSLDYELQTSGTAKTVRLPLTQASQSYRIHCPDKITGLAVDPENYVLKKIESIGPSSVLPIACGLEKKSGEETIFDISGRTIPSSARKKPNSGIYIRKPLIGEPLKTLVYSNKQNQFKCR